MPRPNGLLLLTYLQSSYISLFHLCRLIHQVLQDTLQPRVGVRKLGVEQRSWIIIMQPCPGGRIAYWPSLCLSVRLTVACLRFTRIRKAVKTLNSLAVMMLISGSISHPSTCILSLLPPQRDSTITSRLRSAAIYPRPAIRTQRFTSSVQYFLLDYQ